MWDVVPKILVIHQSAQVQECRDSVGAVAPRDDRPHAGAYRARAPVGAKGVGFQAGSVVQRVPDIGVGVVGIQHVDRTVIVRRHTYEPARPVGVGCQHEHASGGLQVGGDHEIYEVAEGRSIGAYDASVVHAVVDVQL